MLLPAVTVARILDSNLPSKSNINKENSKVNVKGKLKISQVLEKNKIGHKSSSSSSSDQGCIKNKLLKSQTRNIDAIRTDNRNPLSPTGSNNPHLVKRNVKSNDADQSATKIIGNVRTNQSSSSSSNSHHGNVRPVKNQYDNNCTKDQHHHHGGRKYSGDFEVKAKNYSANAETYGKGSTTNYPEYKSRNNGNNSNLPQQIRYSNQSTSTQQQQQQQQQQQIFQRDCNNLPSTSSSKLSSRSETTTTSGATTAHSKALEQHNLVPKMGQINFPPLRAPQSIVNVRHPFLTEARMKQQSGDIGVVNVNANKQKSSVASTLQNSVNELEHNRQTYHGYSSSPIANIPSVQNLANITSIAQYPRPDSFTQQTLASVLFPESSQFPQSPPYATPQVGQINQFQAYDPASFTPTPVNVNSVIPQFSAESSLSYPQFDNAPQFMQTNHYPTADMANSQYQYQAASVGQIPDSPLFIQSLQSPLTVAEQYAAPNYAQALRTELMPRLRRPPRFNK